MEQDLTLREALAADRLDDFVRQEEAMGVELVNGSELERALALLITQHRRAGYRRSTPRAPRMQLDKVAQNILCEPQHPDPV
jgi:type II secretory pathway component PulJ